MTGSFSPVADVPNPDASVQTAGGDSLAVESNSVDLTKMAVQCPDASSLADTPDPRRGVVAAGHDEIAMNLKTPDARLMADQDVLTMPVLDIPDAKCRVSRSRNSGGGVAHLQAPHRRSVSP